MTDGPTTDGTPAGDVAAEHTEATLHLVVTRADGSSCDLGIVARDSTDPWRRTWWRLWGKPRADRRIAAFNREQARRAAAT